LPEFGYRARVLTTAAFGRAAPAEREWEAQALRAWEPLALYRWLFNKQVRAGQAASFVRTDPGSLRGLRASLRRHVLVPDGQLITWLPTALLRGLRALRSQPADILYSTYPPASAHLLGLLLKRLTHLPWVADFRDAWTCDPLDPTLEEMPYRRAFEQRLEEAVVQAADAVLATTAVSAAYLCQGYPRAADRIQVIPNGFEPEEFDAVNPAHRPLPGEPLRLVHTGSFSASHPRRTPQPLFAALDQLRAADPTWADRLRLVLVGHLSPAEQRAAAELVDAGMVELLGPRERHETLACQAAAHALLLVDHVRPRPASNAPGKLFEYLAARRPILALCGTGAVEHLVRQLRAGYCAPADDPQAISRALADLYERFRAGSLECQVAEEALRPFHRRHLARKLARCFDRLLDSPP
jgi:glycosyltransferase involved in cell wall biosynthesis